MEETTEDPERLFRLTSEITLRREVDGRTRRYEGVPVDWSMERDPEGIAFLSSKALEEGKYDLRDEDAVASLFTRAEALRFLEELEKSYPEGEHRLGSVPLPVSTEHLRYGPGGAEGHIEVEGMDVIGYPYLQDAKRTGWEHGDTLLVETTLELPVELAERLEEQPSVASYIEKLEETADAVEAIKDAPLPSEQGGELPF
jgi:hypothetical protein